MSLRRDTYWNIAGMALPLLGAALFIPILLGSLGNEAFGVIALLWTLIGYFGLFDLGVGRALTVAVGRQATNPQAKELSAVLWAGLLITALSGLMGGVLVWALAAPLVGNWLEIGLAWRDDAETAFKIAALGVLPTVITSALRGALEGYGRFATSNLIRLAFGFLMFGLPVLAVQLHGNSLTWVAVYLTTARFFFCLAALVPLRASLNRTISWQRLKQHGRSLLSFGTWLTVTGIVGPLMVYGDRFFVGIATAADQLPYYAIPQEGLLRLLILPTALCGALLPVYASMNVAAMRADYRKNWRRIAALMLAVCVVAVLLATPVLSWWLTPEFAEKAFPIVVLMAAGIWANALAQLPYTALHAHGKSRITALFHLGELPVYFALLYWLVEAYGLAGAAAAWFLRALLDLVLLQLATRRLFKG
jgi:O-antigen/teichoic acid export membrane protein